MAATGKRIICMIIITVVLMLMFVSSGFVTPSQFDETYLGELKDKTERLYSSGKGKVIIIGGSSVPFGVNTSLLEQMIGRTVINYGLYADLGTKVMLDLSKGAIKEGDIIILAPELDKQTYSLYFGPSSMWQACDSDFSLLFKMSSENYKEMFGSYFNFLNLKFKYLLQGKKPQISGVYQKSSFDEYGYISYDRPYSQMDAGYDTSHIIYLDKTIISQEFIDYTNEYIKFAESKGAKVYFSFSPMNMDGIDVDATMEQLEDLVSFIDESFNCEIISDPNYMMYDSGYFYDSNFHLNSAGAIVHTVQLANDIANKLEIELKNVPELPDVPVKPKEPDEPDVYDYDENEKYFTFELVGNRYRITGVSELAKNETSLTVPKAYNGKRVSYLGYGSFAGCDNLTTIYVPYTVDQINDGAFASCPKLKEIYLEDTNPDNITVDNVSMGLTNGMSPSARFVVENDSLDLFQNNYFWGPYASYIISKK